MASTRARSSRSLHSLQHRRVGDSPAIKWLLIGIAIAVTAGLLIMPLVVIFTEALSACELALDMA